MDGALAVYGKMDLSWRAQQLAMVGKKHGFDVFTPIKDFTEQQLQVLLYGDHEPINGNWSNGANMWMREGWEGIIPQTMRLYRQTESEWRKEDIEKFMKARPCNTCNGKRLQPVVLAVQIQDKSIIDVTDLSIEKAAEFFLNLHTQLNEKEMAIAKQVLKEINARLGFLNKCGSWVIFRFHVPQELFQAGKPKESGWQHKSAATSWVSCTFWMNPALACTSEITTKLISTLHRLRDLGNTLIVVEHDEETIRNADYIVDMGPGAGVHGGFIVAEGTPAQVMVNKRSLTGKYLSGELKIEVPTAKTRTNRFHHG